MKESIRVMTKDEMPASEIFAAWKNEHEHAKSQHHGHRARAVGIWNPVKGGHRTSSLIDTHAAGAKATFHSAGAYQVGTLDPIRRPRRPAAPIYKPLERNGGPVYKVA